MAVATTQLPDSLRSSHPPAEPTYRTRRRLDRATFGPEIAKIFRWITGHDPMPWQADWFDIIGEHYVTPAGITIPYYREVGDTVPRQSGKTWGKLAWAWHRAISPRWGGPQQVAWTGQTGKDTRDKWIGEMFPKIETSNLAPFVARLNRGMGNESMTSATGSKIALIGSSPTAGHGLTFHAGVMDELFADKDYRREQMLIPAMSTIENGQRWWGSTAGDADSIVYNAKVKAGRAAVREDTGEGVAYVEYSAPDWWNDEDPEHDELWWTWMPALGHTITPVVVADARRALADQPGEFRRAYGNIPNEGVTLETIPRGPWDRVCSEDVAPDPKRGGVLAVEVERDLSASSIAIADASGAVELIEHRSGTAWVGEIANALAERWEIPQVIDHRGPALAIVDDLEHLGDDGRLPTVDVMTACGAFLDAVLEDGNLRVRAGDADLNASRAGIVKRSVGDLFVWHRSKSTGPVAPLFAATLAWWRATTRTEDELAPFVLVMRR